MPAKSDVMIIAWTLYHRDTRLRRPLTAAGRRRWFAHSLATAWIWARQQATDATKTEDQHRAERLTGLKLELLLLYGRAELTSAGDGYDGEFYVSAIRLDGGARLARPSPVAKTGTFEAELFQRIAAVIENDKTLAGRHAAELFACEYEQSMETDNDMFHKIKREEALEPVA